MGNHQSQSWQQGIEAGFSVNKSRIGQHYSLVKSPPRDLAHASSLCTSVAESWPLPDPT